MLSEKLIRLLTIMKNKSNAYGGPRQILLIFFVSIFGMFILNESAQSEPTTTPMPTQAPTPTPTPHPLLKPAPAPIPTRNPETPIYNKQIAPGASIDVNPDKNPPGALQFDGPGKAKTRIGPDMIKPVEDGNGKPGQGGVDKTKQGVPGVEVDMKF
jgi:hypothetical protein